MQVTDLKRHGSGVRHLEFGNEQAWNSAPRFNKSTSLRERFQQTGMRMPAFFQAYGGSSSVVSTRVRV